MLCISCNFVHVITCTKNFEHDITCITQKYKLFYAHILPVHVITCTKNCQKMISTCTIFSKWHYTLILCMFTDLTINKCIFSKHMHDWFTWLLKLHISAYDSWNCTSHLIFCILHISLLLSFLRLQCRCPLVNNLCNNTFIHRKIRHLHWEDLQTGFASHTL